MNLIKTILSCFAFFAVLVVLTGSASAATFGTVDNFHPLDSLTPNTPVSVPLNGVTGDVIMLEWEAEPAFATLADLHITRDSTGEEIADGSSFTLTSDTESLTITVDKIKEGLNFGTTSNAVLRATNTADSTDTDTVTISHFESFCRTGPTEIASQILDISVDITNRGDNDDSEDDQWFPFDDIEIEVDVDNRGDDSNPLHDLNDLVIELGLIGSNGVNIINDFEFAGSDEEEEEIGDLDPDDDDSFTFELVLEESDQDFEGNFDLVLKVYEQGREDTTCVDFTNELADKNGFSEIIDLDRENDEERFLRFNDISVNPNQAVCGETIRVEADATNVGDDKIEQLDVILLNNALGIRLEERVLDDLKEGDEESISFNFVVPELRDGKYDLLLTANYEVDDDDYNAEEDELVGFTVLGCSGIVGDDTTNPTDNTVDLSTSDAVTISASLSSDAIAGEDIVVTSTITNTGSEVLTVTVDAAAFQSWADLEGITPGVLTLAPGQSDTARLTFAVDEDVSGAQSFVIETNAAGNVEVQEVQVNIEGEESSGFDFGDNSLIWVIAIINIVLIILIILVAVRLSRR